MKLHELKKPSDQSLRESIQRTNDTGINDDVLFSIARTDRDGRWHGSSYEDFMAELDALDEAYDREQQPLQ